MYRSWSDDEAKQEWDIIKERVHVERVRTEIRKNFPRYFASLIKPKEPAGTNLTDVLGTKFKVTGHTKSNPEPLPDRLVFANAIEGYEKEAVRYREFFDAELLQEYRDDDPDAFKGQLSRKCPLIHKLIRSKRDELKEWKFKYNQKSSEELLATFERLIGFANDYLEGQGREGQYCKLDEWEEFDFDGYDEDEAGIPGVVGGGIKSIVLHHLNPRVFPKRSGLALWGLYFLTDRSTFSLRSKTSEFLMINDRLEGRDLNIKMDHNYWYSYALFASYVKLLAHHLEEACRIAKLPFDLEYRYVYVDTFLEHVCDQHRELLTTMRGGDELGY
jgi:hypothetical protein